jgi:hypothetical protein
MAGPDFDKALSDLGDQVNATTTVEASAKALIDGQAAQLADVKAQLKAAGVSDVQMQSLSNYIGSLKSASDDLAADVAANTPAATA